MQTLGLADSMPRTEGRLKSLFWPSIQSANDVDYLGAQGYWVCALVAVFSLAVSAFRGNAIIGVFIFLFYYLGGVGVREHSRYAAAAVFVMYVADTVAATPSIVRIVLIGLLLSNLRATWIASSWKPDSDEANPAPRFDDSWSDKFADKLPTWLWPKVRILFYILSAFLFALTGIGLTMMAMHRR
jgi:hypothetical protein